MGLRTSVVVRGRVRGRFWIGVRTDTADGCVDGSGLSTQRETRATVGDDPESVPYLDGVYCNWLLFRKPTCEYL